MNVLALQDLMLFENPRKSVLSQSIVSAFYPKQNKFPSSLFYVIPWIRNIRWFLFKGFSVIRLWICEYLSLNFPPRKLAYVIFLRMYVNRISPPAFLLWKLKIFKIIEYLQRTHGEWLSVCMECFSPIPLLIFDTIIYQKIFPFSRRNNISM